MLNNDNYNNNNNDNNNYNDNLYFLAPKHNIHQLRFGLRNILDVR